MRHILTLLTGVLFGTGIAISGMANPAKVVNFFDVAGTWDPSLVFVMGGAVTVTFFGYRFVFKRNAPVFEPAFDMPTNRTIDGRLVLGSGLFGIGWGIAGFCPGGALPALGTMDTRVIVFVAAVVVGMFAARATLSFLSTRAKQQPAE